MRITFGMLTSSASNNVNNAAARLMEAQNRASTGKRISKPSDDVPGTSRALGLRSAAAAVEQYTRNSDMVTSQLTAAEDATTTVIGALQQLNSLITGAVNSANGGQSPEITTAQLDTINTQLLSAANTQYLGKYLFSGNLGTTAPVTANGSATPGAPPYLYQGDDGKFVVHVAPGLSMQSNVTARDVFNLGSTQLSESQGYSSESAVVGSGTVTIQVGAGAPVSVSIGDPNATLADLRDAINNASAGVTASITNTGRGDNPYQLSVTNADGTSFTLSTTGLSTTFSTVREASPAPDAGTPDVFTMIKQLKDLVQAGDWEGLSDHLADVQKNLSNTTSVRSEIGARMQRLESSQNSLADSKTRISDLLSKTEDVDLAQAIIDLQTRQNLYQAAIAVAGQVLQTTLQDYLK